MVEERVDQCAVVVAGGRMDDEAGGLVDDDQRVVLEQDVERNVLRDGFGRLGRRLHEVEPVAGRDLLRGVGERCAVEFHGASPYQRLDARARQRRHGAGERRVGAA